jgi:2-oxoglutarate dehydrogenase E2 component (dihydrolipoamide succinyltransferase)
MLEMKVPSPGESITEVQISRWIKKDGDYVEKDEEICEIDSDKATLTLAAEASGILKTLVKEGDTIAVGATVCTIDTDGKAPAEVQKPESGSQKTENGQKTESGQKSEKKEATVVAVDTTKEAKKDSKSYTEGIPSVAADKIMREKGLSPTQVTPTGKGGRITKSDVVNARTTQQQNGSTEGSRNVRREKMTMLRKRVSQRLVAVKQETAMLTTFNEVDMTAIMKIRSQYKDKFKESYGVGLGFMSFFTKAVCEALKTFQAVNAQIDGEEIIYHDYCDIGIAVSAPKGLMVPVVRNAETLSMDQIEKQIAELATKARDGKISIEEMTGGTFTITNGGVFGSMLSTPIINPPQSAILGMHNIVERPVAINGKVEIRPIMYVALSYDHRIIDGRESVSFLVKVKQMLEEPSLLLTGGMDPMKKLLGL